MTALKELLKFDEIGIFSGRDIRGVLKIKYLKKLVKLTNNRLSTESFVMMKRYYKTNNNDYRWRYIACYAEHLRRGNQKVFHRRFEQIKWYYYDKT